MLSFSFLLKASTTTISKADSLAITRYYNLAQYYFYSNSDSTLFYANKINEISSTNGSTFGKLYAYKLLSKYHAFLGDYEKGYSFIDSIFEIANSSDKLDFKVFAFYSKGGFFEENGNLVEAQLAYSEVLKLSTQNQSSFSSQNRTKACIQLANVFAKQGSFDNAIEICNQIIRENNNDTSQYQLLNDVFLIKGNAMLELNMPGSKEAFNLALDYAVKLGDEVKIAIAQSNLGQVFCDEGNYEKAEEYFTKSHQLFLRDGYPQEVGPSYLNIGFLNLRQNKIRSAIDNSVSGLKVLENSQYYEYLVNGYEVLEESYLKLNKIDSMYAASKQIGRFKDSLNSDNLVQLKERMFAEYKLDIATRENKELKNTNELQVQLLSQKNLISYISILFSALVFGSILWGFKQYRKLQNTAINLEQKNVELEQINKRKTEILSIISHDLRNPIAQMLQLETAFKEVAVSEEERLVHSNSIIQSLENGLMMLDNFLIWASDYLSNTVTLKRTNPIEIIDAVVAQVSSAASKKNIFILTQIEEAIIIVNPQLLEIIVRNIVANAIKFSPLNSKVEIFTKQSLNDFSIFVKDNGQGMPSETFTFINNLEGSKIVSQLGTAGERGSGIGLNLSIEFAARINAILRVVESSEKGTTMSIILKRT